MTEHDTTQISRRRALELTGGAAVGGVLATSSAAAAENVQYDCDPEKDGVSPCAAGWNSVDVYADCQQDVYVGEVENFCGGVLTECDYFPEEDSEPPVFSYQVWIPKIEECYWIDQSSVEEGCIDECDNDLTPPEDCVEPAECE